MIDKLEREYKVTRSSEVIVSAAIGVIVLCIFLAVTVSGILLSNNVMVLNDIDLKLDIGFDKTKEAIASLNNAKDNLNLIVIVGFKALIPAVCVFLLARLISNVVLFIFECNNYKNHKHPKKLFMANLSKRIINWLSIILLAIGLCLLMKVVLDQIFGHVAYTINKINDVFTYINNESGSVDNMNFDWWKKHAAKLQEMFIDVNNTYNQQRKEILYIINTQTFQLPTIIYLVLVIISCITWLCSILFLSTYTKNYFKREQRKIREQINESYFPDELD